MSMLRAREKLGAFFHMAEERQHLAEISKALHHKIETYSQSYQLPSEQLLDELIEGYGKTDATTTPRKSVKRFIMGFLIDPRGLPFRTGRGQPKAPRHRPAGGTDHAKD